MMPGRTVIRLALGFAFMALPVFVWAGQSNVIPLATTSQWHLAASQKINPADVSDWGGDPALEKEYGVSSITLSTYTLYPEDESVRVLIESAADASSAYGLFTLYRDDSMTPLKALPLTEVGPKSVVMARGNNFIRIMEPGGAGGQRQGTVAGAKPRDFPFTLSQLQTLLEGVGGHGPSPGELRGLPASLPEAGLIAASEKYLLGDQSAKRVLPSFPTDLIGFSQGAEARLATYRSGNDKVQVLAVTYPTPQIAHARFQTLTTQLRVNDPQGRGGVFGKQTGSYVILALNAGSANAASGVLDRFKTTGYVTWNQRYPGDDTLVFQVVKLVIANLIFSFILAGFGLFGGILFFGSKFIARKWFPKSLWGQPDDATIIRLNLQ